MFYPSPYQKTVLENFSYIVFGKSDFIEISSNNT